MAKYLPLLFAWLVFTLAYSTDLVMGFRFLGKFIYLLIVPLLFCFICLTKRDKRLILQGFVYANLGAILFNLGRACIRSVEFTNGQLQFDASVLRGQTFWYSIVQGGNYFFYDQLSSFMHPTYWGMFLLISVFVILDGFKREQSSKGHIFSWFLLLIFLLFIFLCSSRIVILSAAILLSVRFAILMFYKKSFLLLIAGTGIIVVALITLTKNPRFVGFESYDNLEIFHHSRLEAWKSAFDIFKSNPVFGVGIGDAEPALMKRYLERGYEAGYQNNYNEHNQYLNIANASGLPGLIIFLLAIGVGLRESYRQRSYLSFAFITSFALICVVENLLVRRAGALCFTFFYCLLFMPSRRGPNDEGVRAE
jgi:O-antigen ligase